MAGEVLQDHHGFVEAGDGLHHPGREGERRKDVRKEVSRRSKKDQSGGQNQEAPSSGSLSSCPHTQSGVNPINEPQPQKN